MSEVAVVIGGGQTLGAFLSHGLAQAGYRVAVADLNADNANRVAQQINEAFGAGSACGFQADATDDLKNIHTNVLLMLGGKDINVDVNNTRNTYQALLTRPGQLTVKYYPPSTHNMVDKSVEESLIKSWTLGLFFPRQIFTAGYLADQTRFIADTRCPQ